MDRYGPTCEMIGKKLVVIGGDNFRKSVDVLDLNSLKWSKVIVKSPYSIF